MKKKTLKTKGVLLIALGREYNKLAYNLTKSIKKHNSTLQVACITDSTDNEFLDAFDQVIKPRPLDYVEGYQFNPFKLKTFMYDYSPFDETIYLDVDAVCLKDISGLFSNFKIQEVGRYKKDDKCDCVWFKSLPEIFDVYNLENYYPEYNTSFISFIKSDENDQYFSMVKRLYNDRRFDYTKIGMNYPDEVAFGIASSMLNQYCSTTGEVPICFWWSNKKLTLEEIKEKYYFIGFAGGFVASKYLGYYHGLIKQLSPHWKLEMKNKIFHKK